MSQDNTNFDNAPVIKLSKEYENPIDYYMYNYICEYTSPLFYTLGISPNMITTLSLITGLYSTSFVTSQQYNFAILFLWISYYFDCLDGHVARKYKQCSSIGCYYDHLKDISVTSYLIYKLLLKFIELEHELLFSLSIFLFAVGLAIQMGLQELNTTSQPSPFLKVFVLLCKNSLWEIPKEFIIYTKFLGCGTFFMLLSVLMVWCHIVEVNPLYDS